MNTNKYQLIVAGLLVALGIYFGAMALGNSIIVVKDKDRVVTVKGLSEKEFPADRVIWPLTYKEIGNDLPSLYNAINNKNDIIVNFLKANGITNDEISVSAPQIIDMQAERYANNISPYRYNITSVVTVTTGKVDLVRKLIDKQVSLLKQDIAIIVGDYQYTTQFLFTKLNEVKPSMIEEATKNARISAEKFAKDSDSELGKIRNANQGQFSISDRDANTPYIKSVRVVTTVDYYLED